MGRLLSALMLFLVLVLPAEAATTYYVDASIGSSGEA